MAVSATVTAGKIFSEDEVVTISELNKLGTPTVDISGAVGSLSLADGSVTNAKIAAATGIQYDKLEALATGELVVGNAGTATATALSGDATIAADGTVTIAADAVTTVKVLNANITTAKLADSTGASDGVTTAKLATGAVTGPKIAMTSDAQGDILIRGASNYERLATGDANQVLTSGGSGENPTWENSASIPAQTVFTSSGTWTNPGANWVEVICIGAGSSKYYGHADSGNGGACMQWVDVSGGSNVTVTVGTGGDYSTITYGGVAGGPSSFGSHIVCGGGTNGGGVATNGAVTTSSDVATLMDMGSQETADGPLADQTIGSGGTGSEEDGYDGIVIVKVVG